MVSLHSAHCLRWYSGRWTLYREIVIGLKLKDLKSGLFSAIFRNPKYYCVVMPRDVCSVYGCATARSHGYGIFRVSLFEDNAQQIWRDHLASIFGPRVGGEQFVDLLNEGRAMICEKHFKEADVISCKISKKVTCPFYSKFGQTKSYA